MSPANPTTTRPPVICGVTRHDGWPCPKEPDGWLLPLCRYHEDRAVKDLLNRLTIADTYRGCDGPTARVVVDGHPHLSRGLELPPMRTPRPKAPWQTYVCQQGPYVKIGRSHDPDQRVQTLGSEVRPADLPPGDKRPVVLLLTIDGDVENLLHIRWHEYRAAGEWFRLEGDLSTWVEAAMSNRGRDSWPCWSCGATASQCEAKEDIGRGPCCDDADTCDHGVRPLPYLMPLPYGVQP
jgi:hypothetical protein